MTDSIDDQWSVLYFDDKNDDVDGKKLNEQRINVQWARCSQIWNIKDKISSPKILCCSLGSFQKTISSLSTTTTLRGVIRWDWPSMQLESTRSITSCSLSNITRPSIGLNSIYGRRRCDNGIWARGFCCTILVTSFDLTWKAGKIVIRTPVYLLRTRQRSLIT